MRLVPLLSLSAALLLSACTPKPAEGAIQKGNVSVMLALDPSITTVYMEAARLSALRATTTIAISPGKYCANFVQQTSSGPLAGRIELTLEGRDRYLYAERYTQGDLVRNDNQAGVYQITGQALTLLASDNRERTIPVTGTTTDTINRWGDVPLSRTGCTAPPLQGQPLADLLAEKQKEQRTPLPWTTDAARPLSGPAGEPPTPAAP